MILTILSYLVSYSSYYYLGTGAISIDFMEVGGRVEVGSYMAPMETEIRIPTVL